MGVPLGFLPGYCSFPGGTSCASWWTPCSPSPRWWWGSGLRLHLQPGSLGQWQLLFTIPGMAIGQTILALPIVLSSRPPPWRTRTTACATLLTLGAGGRMLLLSTLWGRHQILLAALGYGRVTAEVGVSMMLGGNIKWREPSPRPSPLNGKGEFSRGLAWGSCSFSSFLINGALAFLRRRRRHDAPSVRGRNLVCSYQETGGGDRAARHRRRRPTAFVGHNGSGKSTLFRALAFLLKPESGSLTFLGQPVEGREEQLRRDVTMLLQDPYSFAVPSSTMAYGLKARGAEAWRTGWWRPWKWWG